MRKPSVLSQKHPPRDRITGRGRRPKHRRHDTSNHPILAFFRKVMAGVISPCMHSTHDRNIEGTTNQIIGYWQSLERSWQVLSAPACIPRMTGTSHPISVFFRKVMAGVISPCMHSTHDRNIEGTTHQIIGYWHSLERSWQALSAPACIPRMTGTSKARHIKSFDIGIL